MSADFWSGYVSGVAGILIGNPLDLVKTRLQAGKIVANLESTATAVAAPRSFKDHFDRAGTLVRAIDPQLLSIGTTAPLLGYGALNALLFVTYNRTLTFLGDSPVAPTSFFKVWCAGATGGLATFVVSAPTELIKCRAQVSTDPTTSSWTIARDIWKREGMRGLYYGGGITSIRDAVGYGFYFWSYEYTKQSLTSPTDTDRQTALKVLLCGGLAGIVTWASIFPLDVIKTRVQTQTLHPMSPADGEHRSLLSHTHKKRLTTLQIAREAYRIEGPSVFFRGLGICSVRAFVVNAVQWAVYEWMMRLLQQT